MNKYLSTGLFTIILLILSAYTSDIKTVGILDLNNLFNYENQTVPNYITRDNTNVNPISDEGASLGRVLFYDQTLSVNSTVACANCHQQQFAFGDTAAASVGVNGTTGRHSMRLINARFSDEENFFWDERAATLELQTTMPIQDHAEMGFSGANGDPAIDSLIRKMAQTAYYPRLFEFVFGDTAITEARMQHALAQFIRSIQSFDSKYDIGRASAPANGAPFSNFTSEENSGKQLFMLPPTFDPNGVRTSGGAGCAGCHNGSEFSISENAGNNGIVGSFDGSVDDDVTRSPSLRDLVNGSGVPNGQFMHDASLTTLEQVIDHYDNITPVTGLDPRLRPNGNDGQQLQLSTQEKADLVAFLKTLSGSNVYTDEKWSNPFDANGNLSILPFPVGLEESVQQENISIFPNPAHTHIYIKGIDAAAHVRIWDMSGKLVLEISSVYAEQAIDLSELQTGIYLIEVLDSNGDRLAVSKHILQ